MPVFYFLVIIGAVAFWFLASSLYRPLGWILHLIFRDTKDCMSEDDEGDKKE